MWRVKVQLAERLGYCTLLLLDHLDDQTSPMPALVAAADSTTTMRLGTHVLNADLREPGRLAHEVRTVQMLCGGRLELGLGAGSDYPTAGRPFEAGSRLRRPAAGPGRRRRAANGWGGWHHRE